MPGQDMGLHMHLSNPWRLFACPEETAWKIFQTQMILDVFSSLFCITLGRIDYPIKLAGSVQFLIGAEFFSTLQCPDWLWAHQTSDAHTHSLYSPMHHVTLKETALAYKTTVQICSVINQKIKFWCSRLFFIQNELDACQSYVYVFELPDVCLSLSKLKHERSEKAEDIPMV